MPETPVFNIHDEVVVTHASLPEYIGQRGAVKAVLTADKDAGRRDGMEFDPQHNGWYRINFYMPVLVPGNGQMIASDIFPPDALVPYI